MVSVVHKESLGAGLSAATRPHCQFCPQDEDRPAGITVVGRGKPCEGLHETPPLQLCILAFQGPRVPS